MTTTELSKANLINQKIIEKKAQIRAFEMGKIKSIIVRNFNDIDCTQHDTEMTIGIPRNTIKLAMLEVLKADLTNLQFQFDNLKTNSDETIQSTLLG
jgi:hypothetical protein